MRISMLFFLEFYIFYDSIKFFLDLLDAKILWLVSQLSLTLELSSQSLLIRRQESALFLSLQSVEVSKVFSFVTLKSLKKEMISAQTYLKLFILFQLSIINSCKKYLTFMDLLKPIHLGSNRNLMLCWVRQLARDSISNYNQSIMSSPMSSIHFQRVRGTYSQQKQKVSSPMSSKCSSWMRCQLVRVYKNATIFLTMSSYASLLQINFFLTTTLFQSLVASFNSPKGKFSFISTTVDSLPIFASVISIYQIDKLKQADNYQYFANKITYKLSVYQISSFIWKRSKQIYFGLKQFLIAFLSYNPSFIMPVYNFNPWSGADHNRKKYLGQPGLCSVFLGTEHEDPKYKGPCGPQYSGYRECLMKKQFYRDACKHTLQTLTLCQKTKLSDMSKQIQILQNWRKNKGVPVKPSFTPFKIFEQGPQCIDYNKS